MKIRRFIPLIVYMLVLFLVFSWTGILFGNTGGLSYSQVVELFREEQVKSFVVSDNTITLELHNPYNGETRIAANMADPESFRAELGSLFREQYEAGILENYDFLSVEEKNQLWKLVLEKVTVFRSQEDELMIHIYPNLPK